MYECISLVPRPSSPSSNIWEAEKKEETLSTSQILEEREEGLGTRLCLCDESGICTYKKEIKRVSNFTTKKNHSTESIHLPIVVYFHC